MWKQMPGLVWKELFLLVADRERTRKSELVYDSGFRVQGIGTFIRDFQGLLLARISPGELPELDVTVPSGFMIMTQADLTPKWRETTSRMALNLIVPLK